MPSFPPFLFMSTAQEGRLSSKRRFPELGTYAPALLNPVSRRSVRRHRNPGSYRPQNRAKCGHFIPGLTCHRGRAECADSSTQLSKGRAVCGNSARTDLCGGRFVRIVPTATANSFFELRSLLNSHDSHLLIMVMQQVMTHLLHECSMPACQRCSMRGEGGLQFLYKDQDSGTARNRGAQRHRPLRTISPRPVSHAAS